MNQIVISKATHFHLLWRRIWKWIKRAHKIWILLMVRRYLRLKRLVQRLSFKTKTIWIRYKELRFISHKNKISNIKTRPSIRINQILHHNTWKSLILLFIQFWTLKITGQANRLIRAWCFKTNCITNQWLQSIWSITPCQETIATFHIINSLNKVLIMKVKDCT